MKIAIHHRIAVTGPPSPLTPPSARKVLAIAVDGGICASCLRGVLTVFGFHLHESAFWAPSTDKGDDFAFGAIHHDPSLSRSPR